MIQPLTVKNYREGWDRIQRTNYTSAVTVSSPAQLDAAIARLSVPLNYLSYEDKDGNDLVNSDKAKEYLIAQIVGEVLDILTKHEDGVWFNDLALYVELPYTELAPTLKQMELANEIVLDSNKYYLVPALASAE